jgi:hypothetical protein
MPLIQTHPGQVFWVGNGTALMPDSVGGADGNPGTFQRPFATLQYAINACLANRGDIIMAKPGHAETVSTATALAFNKAGVAIVGLGSGSLRPKLTLDTAATATIGLTAANMSLQNFVVTANFADITSAVTGVAAKYFSLERVEFAATAVNMNFLHVIDTGTVTDDMQGLSIRNCRWLEPDALTLAFALVDGTNSDWEVSNNFIVNGNATVDTAAMFTIAAGKLLTRLKDTYNTVQVTGNAASTAGLWLTTNGTTNSGIVANNMLKHIDATTEIWQTSNAGFGLFNNTATAVGTAQGYPLPAIDA